MSEEFKSPILVTGTLTPSGTQDVNVISPIPLPVIFTPSGTQDVNIVSSIILSTLITNASLAVTGPLTDTELRASPVPVTIPTPVPVSQDTSPWVVSGSITTSPDVNIHDSSGNVLSSTGTSLDTNVTNTVTINGTVIANAGTNLNTSLLALDSTLTNATQKSQIVNSSGVAVDARDISTTPINGDVGLITNSIIYGHTTAGGGSYVEVKVNPSGALTVDASGSSVSVSNFPATQAVTQSTSPWIVSLASTTITGTVAVTQSTSPWVVSLASTAITGNVTVVQPTGTNLHTVLDSGTLTSITNALPAGSNVIGHVIADSGSTTVVTGNVTVVQPTGTNLHTVIDSGTVSVTQSTSPWVENVSQFGGSNVVTGTGTSGAGIPRVTVSNDSNILATQSGTWTVQPGNTPNTSPWLIEQRAPGTLTSYSASVLALTVAATPTDIFTLYGSGTKTIRITRIELSATENTSAVRDVVLIKRSATNTGGTSSAATLIPHDSNNAAATATVLSYTTNPAALGASVGNIRTAKLDIPATNLVGNTDHLIWTFGDRPSQAIVLRGTSQGIAINLNSITSASNSFDISIEWTEE